MKEVDNILRILKKVRKLIDSDEFYEIKSLSNQTIHSATISQDPDNIIVAVLIYSLGKIMEREHYRNLPGWNEFHSTFIKNLDIAISSLEKNKLDECRNALGRIRNSINKIDSDLSKYIRDVFSKAQINKAFKLYEHGLSAKQTAELLGVSLWDMASYIGQSKISEARVAITMPISKRIKIAEEFFG